MELEESQKGQKKCSVMAQISDGSEAEALPPGIILLEHYQKDFYDMLQLQGNQIPRNYFLSLPPRKLKVVCTVKVVSSLLAFPTFQCFLKFDQRFTMAAQKGILGKTVISTDVQPKEDGQMLAKLSSNLTKDQYKLYESVKTDRSGQKGRVQLATIRYSKQSDIILMPKVEDNTRVSRVIKDPHDSYLESQYKEAKTRVNAMKLYRSEFRCQSLKRTYYSLKDLMETSRANKLVLRRISKAEWEYSYWHPLSPLQAFGIVLSIIDKGCT